MLKSKYISRVKRKNLSAHVRNVTTSASKNSHSISWNKINNVIIVQLLPSKLNVAPQHGCSNVINPSGYNIGNEVRQQKYNHQIVASSSRHKFEYAMRDSRLINRYFVLIINDCHRLSDEPIISINLRFN